jgi:hypothetical protein
MPSYQRSVPVPVPVHTRCPHPHTIRHKPHPAPLPIPPATHARPVPFLAQMLVYSMSGYSDDVDAVGAAGAPPQPATVSLEARLPLLAPSAVGLGFHHLSLHPCEALVCVRWQALDAAGSSTSTSTSTNANTNTSSVGAAGGPDAEAATTPAGYPTRTLAAACAVQAPLLCVLTTQRLLLLSPALVLLAAVSSLLPLPTPRPLSVADLSLTSAQLARAGPLFRCPITSVGWVGDAVVLGSADGALSYVTAGGGCGRLAGLPADTACPVVVAALPDRLAVLAPHWTTGRTQVGWGGAGRGEVGWGGLGWGGVW